MAGSASTTAAMAWMDGIAVMMWPSTKKSSSVLAEAIMSGGGRNPTCMLTVGLPSTVIFQPDDRYEAADDPQTHAVVETVAEIIMTRFGS